MRKKYILLCAIIILTLLCSFALIGCSEKTFKITFDVGIDDHEIQAIEAKAGSPIEEPTQPQRDGYIFEGWEYENGDIFVFDAMPNRNITLTARWTKLYSITFDVGIDDQEIQAIEAKAGSPIEEPTQPQRDGYIFDGWECENGNVFVFDVMPNRSITLTARWTKLYTISFDVGIDDQEIQSIEAKAGTPIEEPTQPQRDGYIFDGWECENGDIFVFDVMPNCSITLTARWAKLYTITFETNIPDITFEPIIEPEGTEILAPQLPPEYYVINWTLDGNEYEFSFMPANDIVITANIIKLTNLPTILINLFDENGDNYPLIDVNKEDYITSSLSIINTDSQFLINSVQAGFRGRGNGSWLLDKKGYKIKFDKKQSLFGREKNKHWVLIPCSNFFDPTMSRNYLAYNMANEVFSDLEYSTMAEWVDVYVNGSYHGLYILCEHVRVDKGRVDIKSEYNVEDTGYLIEYDAYAKGIEGIDWFTIDGVKYPFTVHSPDPEDYSEEGVSEEEYRRQVAFIQDYVSRVYTAALTKDYSTFSTLVDVDSFVDMYILHELFKNVDTGYSSFYMYKKPGGKLFLGPPWDFDATTNIGERGDRSPTGIYVADKITEVDGIDTSSELFISLYNTPEFFNLVRNRWQTLSPLITQFLDERMNDDVYEANRVAMGQNYAKWENKSQETAEIDWINEMKILKQWLIDRITWLDEEWALN